ncbi:MAG: hypothetical protein QM477_10040 [Planctomycetota bacterium]
MSRTALSLFACLLAAPLAAQTEQFSAVLDQPNNVISWSVNTSIGAVNLSPSTFRIGGSVELLLDSANAPYTSGALNGALAFTSPTTLSGEIPNPIPFFPPLATFDIKNMEFHLASPTFVIAPNGDFTAMVVLTTTAGTNTMGGLFGSGTESIAGVASTPTPVTGNVSQSGTTITYFLDMGITVTLVDPGTGVSSDITFNGPFTGFANSTENASFHLEVPLPMVLGANSLAFTGATPNGAVFLAGSLASRGSVFIASLNATLGLSNPVQAGAATADALGNGSFPVNVPGTLVGRSVWLQAVELNSASNAAGTWIG